MKANQIIEEALQANIIDEANERDTSFLGRLFYRPPSDSQMKSRTIRYLSDRLMQEMNEKQTAIEKEYNAHRLAKKCVEIYGIEAELLLEKMWNS